MEERNWDEINKRFERNRLGRAVTNSERVQKLLLTLEESIAHMSMDDQIKHLSSRLEEIGGTKFRAAEFEFDEGPSWAGFTDGKTWNGWACPWFDKDTAIAVLDWMGEGNSEDYSLTYEVEGELITLIDSNCPEEPWTLEPNENGLYDFGGSWTWSEKQHYCALCNNIYDPEDDGAEGEFCSQACKEDATSDKNALERTKDAIHDGKLAEQPKKQVLLAYLQMHQENPGMHPDDSMFDGGGYEGWMAVIAYDVIKLGKFGILPDIFHYPTCVLTICDTLMQYQGFHNDDEDDSLRCSIFAINDFVNDMHVSDLELTIQHIKNLLGFHGGGEPEGVAEPMIDLLSNLVWISKIQ